jgi:alpha-beta hydrolase superfamily lysophospholipase
VLETVSFASDGLNLSGVVHVPDDHRPGERRPAIIMMHGFGANKSGGPEWICEQFADWGYVALRFDYRGCGDSEGERGRVIPAEEVADARNAVTYMAARADVDAEAIALCGSSLGGGVAVQAAGLDPRVAAVIVENGVAMHSATDTVTNYEEAFSFVRRAKPPVELHLFDGVTHFMFVNADPRVALTLHNWLDRYFPARRLPA